MPGLMKEIAEKIVADPVNALSISSGKAMDLLIEIKKLLKLRNEFPLIRIPSALNTNTTVYFAGDTHGDYESSHALGRHIIISSKRNLSKPGIVILLGDYVDRAPEGLKFGSIINIFYLLSLKYLYPDRIYLLRGNHEAFNLRRFSNYELPIELNTHFGKEPTKLLHSMLLEVFSLFPIFVRLENGIFAAHGGFPRTVTDLSKIQKNDTEPILHTLWGDPKESKVFRGDISLKANFSKPELISFLDTIGASVMIRGHDYSTMGYPMYENRLITVFTSKTYKTRGSQGILVIKANPIKQVRTVFDLEMVELDKGRFKKRKLDGI
jgi:hypothetical protein